MTFAQTEPFGRSGQLVSLDEMLALLKKAIDSRSATSKGFLIDGYPREVSTVELTCWSRRLSSC